MKRWIVDWPHEGANFPPEDPINSENDFVTLQIVQWMHAMCRSKDGVATDNNPIRNLAILNIEVLPDLSGFPLTMGWIQLSFLFCILIWKNFSIHCDTYSRSRKVEGLSNELQF